MAEIAIYQDDTFGIAALTAAINDREYVPGSLAALGLFHEEGVATLTLQIERGRRGHGTWRRTRPT